MADYKSIHEGVVIDTAVSRTINNEDFTLAEKNKLFGIDANAQANTVASVNNKTGDVHIFTTDLTDYSTIIAGKENVTPYTPTLDYHPATKKYVDDTTGINIETEQFRYVSKNGDDNNNGYSWNTAKATIQAVIDSITDASQTKQYTIRIASGWYYQNVDLSGKPYVHLFFVGETTSNKLISSTSPVIKFPTSGQSRIAGARIELLNPTVSDGVSVLAPSGTAEIELRLCSVRAVNSNAGVYLRNIEADCAEFRILRSDVFHSNSDISTQNTDYSLIKIKGSTLFIGQALALFAQINQGGSANVNYFDFQTTGQTLTTTTIFNMLISSNSYTGNAVGYRFSANTSAKQDTNNGAINCFGNGSGIGKAYFIDATSNVVVNVNASSIFCTGFASNYTGETTNVGNILNLNFVPIDDFSTIVENDGIINKNVIQNGQYETNVAIIDENLLLNTSVSNNTLEELLSIVFSSGWVSGGGYTDNGNGTITINNGSGLIRVSNNEQAQIKSFDWNETIINTLVDQSSNYIYVDYNNGNPIITSTTDRASVLNNENNKFELYEVFAEGTILHITPHFQKAKNVISLLQKKEYEIFGIEIGEGIELSSSNLNIQVSSGVLWIKQNEIIINAIDTSLTDTFDTYYLSSSTTWNKISGVSIFDVAQFNNPITGLVNYGNNQYGFMDFYIESDNGLVGVYCQAEYGSQSSAEIAESPQKPPRLKEHGLYIGRVVFQESGTSALNTISFSGGVNGTLLSADSKTATFRNGILVSLV